MNTRRASLTFGLLIVWMVATAPALAVSPAPVLSHFRLVAVAPFTDEVGMRQDVARLAAEHLAVLLAWSGIKVVPPDRVEQSLQQLSLRPLGLISPTAAGNVARLVGADVIITGRLIHADVDREQRSATGGMAGPPEAFVNLEMRVMIVDGPRLFYDDVSGYAIGVTGLIRATDFAIRDFLRHVTGNG